MISDQDHCRIFRLSKPDFLPIKQKESLLQISIPEAWHFCTDPDPDSRIRTSD
jgi:hypothetical protein